ncbi:hypothetical protein LJK87_09260 [Paenibacillus sp. P25]|nr:hypothetical protein LJK87_09260 [Paenibacillus sp. P25]
MKGAVMKDLVLAEKPSVAKEIARVLGCGQKHKHYFEGPNYVVTWALGHLVTLAEPEEYDSKYKTWSLDDLPLLPERMKLKVIRETTPQFKAIQQTRRTKRSVRADYRHGRRTRGRARGPVDHGADPLEEAVQAALDFLADG